MYYEITFPHLGLTMNPSRVALTVLGKPIYWYGVVIALGFLTAVLYCTWRSREFGITSDNIIDMLIVAVPLGVIGARAYYCAFEWDSYKADPISILYIWEGGLAIYGGILGAVAGLLLVCRFRHINTGAMLDVAGLGLPIGQAFGRWGNFFNREAFGVIREGADPFLKMGLQDAAGVVTYVHPTFFYESAWNVLGLVLLHFLSKKRKFDGQVFVLYVAWYGLGRGIIEGLRADSLYFAGTNLRVSQLLAFASCIIAVGILVWQLALRDHEPEDLYVNRKNAAPETAEEGE